MNTADRPRLGVLVPSGNAAVEPELSLLLAGRVNVYGSRLPTLSEYPLNERIHMYLDAMPAAIKAFGRLAPDAIVAQCSGSHYLQGPDGDRAFCEELSALAGATVTSVTQTVLEALELLGADTITLISPYAPWLSDLSRSYWEAAGLKVRDVVVVRSKVGFSPYDVDGAELVRQVRQARRPTDEVLLFTGTGMFTLDPLADLGAGRDQVMLTSNLCTAWWAARTLLPHGEATSPTTYTNWPLKVIRPQRDAT
jgi:maleate isomerase